MNIENSDDLLRVWHTRGEESFTARTGSYAIAAVRVRASGRSSECACVYTHKHCCARPGPVLRSTVVYVVVSDGVQCQGRSHIRRAHTTLSTTSDDGRYIIIYLLYVCRLRFFFSGYILLPLLLLFANVSFLRARATYSYVYERV